MTKTDTTRTMGMTRTTGMTRTMDRPTAATGRPHRPYLAAAQRLTDRLSRFLARYSIVALRVSLGLVILGFGALKFIPGASPAEDLAVRTVEALTFGIVSGPAALLATALTEAFLGIVLITGKLLRVGLVVMAGWLVGIMSPLVLFFPDLFPGAPTLEAQYVLKDIVLATAGMVIAARALGARLIREQ